MLSDMETFLVEEKTKNGVLIKVCGICQRGCLAKVSEAYKTGIEKVVFNETKDEYLLDFYLNQIIVSLASKEVMAVGASVCVEGVCERSGGIIGNPFETEESAEDDVEYVGNGLYCAAFSGRFGAVFLGSCEKAKIVKEKFSSYISFENEKAVELAEKLLKEISDIYILVSDGSGKSGFHYVSAYEKQK